MSFPRVVIAVDKFKGLLNGVELSEAIGAGMLRALGLECFEASGKPVGHGGVSLEQLLASPRLVVERLGQQVGYDLVCGDAVAGGGVR